MRIQWLCTLKQKILKQKIRLRSTGQSTWPLARQILVWLGFATLLFMLPALSAVAQKPAQVQQRDTIYMPSIPAYAEQGAATPVATVAAGTRVYGLLGTISRPTGARHTYYLSTANNGYYALAGETPQIEQRIGELTRGSEPRVKVWGVLQPLEATGEPPLIVVTGILATDVSMPAASPAVSPTPIVGTSVPIAVVRFQVVNLYGGPGSTYPVVGKVVQRQACEVTGRNQPSTWLQLTCADGQQGWVDARLVEVTGAVASVTVINIVVATPTPIAATPTPTPQPTTFSGWRTELFNNPRLAGTPVAVVDVPNVNFNWGSGAPSEVPEDGFSARFSRRITVSPAFYQFAAVADDGIRVWLDGRLIINAWPANPSQSYVVGQVLIGSHDVVVEYYEQSGLANVRLDYAPVSATGAWLASYYYGITPAGNPAFAQQEPRGRNPLEYNWASGSPTSNALGASVVGSDYWSARWQGDFPFEAGNYVFRANVDDGVRLYIDGLLVLDHWRDGYIEVSNRVLGIGAGQHTMVVEYYERTGNASLQVWWYRDSAYTGPQ